MTKIEISWQSAPWWFGIKWRSLCVERMPRRPQLFAKEVQSLWLKLERSLCCLFAQNFVTAAFPPPVQEAKIWKSASYFAMVVTIIIAIMIGLDTKIVQSLPWNCVLSLHLIEKGKCWIKNIKEWEGLLGLWKHRHPEEGKLAPREGLLNKSSKWLAETNDFTFLHNQLRIYTGGGSGHRPDKPEVAEEHGHEEINLCVM